MIFQALVAAPLGAVAGSFAVTAGLRWARGEQALTGRSRCDACAAPLNFAATVPIVSFVRLGGVCACCRAAIHRGHPVGEVAGALGTALAFLVLPTGPALAVATLGLALIGGGAADVASRRLPDLATVIVASLGLLLALERGIWGLACGVVASVVATLALLALRGLFTMRRGEPGLGLGDVKLIAALALWLGAATPWAIAGASLLGLAQLRLARPADGRAAFGPALAVGGWVTGLVLQAGLLGDLFP